MTPDVPQALVDAALWTSCPVCDALPGSKCIPDDPNRVLRRDTHDGRVKAVVRDRKGLMGAPKGGVWTGGIDSKILELARWTSCETCDALPGDPCIPDKKRIPGGFHGTRVKAAIRDLKAGDSVLAA